MPTISPENHQEKETNTFDFRAPPPSPIGSSRRASSVANDEVLTEFLEHSLRVPDLILPDRIFPRQKPFRDILDIDFQALNSAKDDLVLKIRDSLSETGCFQVINHGISPELIKTAVRRAGRVFRMSPEKKRMAVRSTEMEFGFEDQVSGEQEEVVNEMGEEFVWGMGFGFKLNMEGIWPNKFSKFSDKMETLASSIEKIAKDIMLILNENYPNTPNGEGHTSNLNDCVCHIYKHPHDVSADQCLSSLRYDVIRMMIKGSDYSHALSLHVCDGSSEFHVYSKKGWISFTPLKKALIVTAGDQLQAWSGGRYKQVIGRPIYTFQNKDCISLAFFCSPPNLNTKIANEFNHQEKKERIISLRQQALFAIVFTIACQLLINFYCKLSHP
ncbi:1-aminocyclopropane-1-carboxylate oxidase-like [Chenopodium quinoa]|uniref:1-aminocyclopropane-1-carboxylate oxidase-like n=1 Tax=Chenopodium quinoa TaxID=63459 RepID=UPI000B791617|nr:1-aminocyclopropane-1-carboxylate oxidase-like [Chenopodium quinoa]